MLGKQEKDKRGRKEAALRVSEETGLTAERGTELYSPGALWAPSLV